MKTENHFIKIIALACVVFSHSFSECTAQDSKNEVENYFSIDTGFLRRNLIAHLSDVKMIIEGMEESRNENTRNIASKLFDDRERICNELLTAAQNRDMLTLKDSITTELEKIFAKSKILRKKFMQNKSKKFQEAILVTSIEEAAPNDGVIVDETSSAKSPEIKKITNKDPAPIEKELSNADMTNGISSKSDVKISTPNISLKAGGGNESLEDKKWNVSILNGLDQKAFQLKEESTKQYSKDIQEIISTMQSILNDHRAIFVK